MSQDKSPSERKTASKSVTGEEIIQQLVENLDASLEPLRYSVLVPGVFDVYLHAKDYEKLSGIFSTIKQEARRALEEHVASLAQPSERGGLFSRKVNTAQKEYKNAAGGWYISFYENGDADVQPGDILIDSRLTLPQTQEVEGGSMTRRISTLRRGGATEVIAEQRLSAAAQLPGNRTGVIRRLEELPPPLGPLVSPRPTGAEHTFQGRAPQNPSSSSQLRSPQSTPVFDPKVTTERRPRAGRARLSYTSSTGRIEFVIDKPEVAVGRGGTGVWVDLRLDAAADVSRTHFKIRRDEQGRFFIRDLSAYGTSVNDHRLPSSLEQQGERKIDRMREELLPPRAKLDLAGVLTLDFEVL